MNSISACPILAGILQRLSHLALRTSSYGYLFYCENGKMNYLHREVAKVAYGDIPPGYHVHHIDGDKSNNQAVNLEILTNSEHIRKHRPRKKIVICDRCGTEFSIKNKDFLRSEQHYCSTTCRDIGQRKLPRPDAVTLFHQMQSISNWSKIGKLYGVSDNTVRKWAKQYDLDLSVCNGRVVISS